MPTSPAPQVKTEPSAGRPVALSALAAMLLRLHGRPPVRLVEPAELKKTETTTS